MKNIILFIALYLMSCGPSNKLKKYYTPEDASLFELVERLSKNSNDGAAAKLLPEAYNTVLAKRQFLTAADFGTLAPGDRYLRLAKEWAVMLQLHDKIIATPAAKNIVPQPWDPTFAIAEAKTTAAKEFYNQGLEDLNVDDRRAARNALDNFNKANSIIPGYQDVRNLIREATEKATINVIVRAANYYNQGWDYWGFQNDWLQQQIISDLNSQSFRDVRFYSDWDANTRQIRADRMVELNFTELYVGRVFSNRSSTKRSAQIQTGTTNSTPPKPIYQTVYATVFTNTNYMQSRATLECRIYDLATGNNLLYDRFPGNDDWRIETATYSGDQRALTPQDWNRINNNVNQQPPSREQVADRLIRNCYNLLISRIKSGIQFGS